jgi:uncharacterized protein YggE
MIARMHQPLALRAQLRKHRAMFHAMTRIFIALLLSVATAVPQTIRRSVRAFGEGSVSAAPDQARVTVNVIAQAQTAAEAASQNSTQVANVISALRGALGTAGQIRTLSYTLTPNYNTPRDGSRPVIVGFTAANALEVVVNNLTLVGRIVDSANQAGATRVDGLRMTIRDEDPLRTQALRTATQRARAKAEAMASGLGLRLGSVLLLDEGVSVRPVDVAPPGNLAVTTPVEPGTLDVRATVTLELELLQ